MIKLHTCQTPQTPVTQTLTIFLLLLIFEPLITSCSFFNSQNYPNFSFSQAITSPQKTQAEIFAQILNQTLEETKPLARQIANDTAEKSWNALEENLIANIDDFLNWYFNYFNQKGQDIMIGINYSDALIKNEFDWKVTNQEFNTKFIENFQELFAKKVLEPEQVDIKIREIAFETLKKYLWEIEQSLDAVPEKYNINQTNWRKYLNEIVIIIKYGKNHQLSLPLKSISTLENNQKIKQLIATEQDWVKNEMLAKIAKQGASKILAKTGTNTAAVLGVRIIGKKIIALGGIAWELWDYNHAIEVEKPAMRQQLINNLILVKDDVLYQPEYGILSVIDKLEIAVRDSL
ncbi:MAG: hypothetical protein WBA93_32150 [Microcoleaceae cyanobacterium]